jgi:hypothetical protein
MQVDRPHQQVDLGRGTESGVEASREKACDRIAPAGHDFAVASHIAWQAV